MKVLVTGAAGFIGAHTCLRLLRDGHQVLGLDNFNDYYDPALKQARVQWVQQQAGDFPLHRLDLADRDAVARLFAEQRPDVVIHLAAQAGVRYSLKNPQAYLDSNLAGFLNILEGCRRNPVQHLLYASSSSVYGANQRTPYRVEDGVDHPLSLYAATKKANEAMAHSYSHLFGIPSSGLRFFTVYGPWGRPDMSPMQFARAISEGRPIQLFNHGRHQRDFTYIDDIVESLVRLMPHPPHADPGRLRPGCGQQPGALAAVQHRRPTPGGTARLPGPAGAAPAAQRGNRAAAAATGRCPGHLRRCQRPGPGYRFYPPGQPRRRPGALRRLVPGLLLERRGRRRTC